MARVHPCPSHSIASLSHAHPNFGDLRARLHEPASRANWDALCALIDAALERDPREVIEVWLPYAIPQLMRWPPRFRLAPKHWLERWKGGEFCPEMLLCAAFEVGNKEDASSLAKLADAGQIRHLEINTRSTAPRIVWRLLSEDVTSKLEYLYLYQRNASIFDRVRRAWRWDKSATAKLFDESNTATLRGLSLDLQELDEAGVRALLVHPRMKQLRQLKLRSSTLESLDHTIRTLPTPEHLANLEVLAIPQAKLGPGAAAMLAGVPWSGALDELILDRNPLGDEQLAALLSHEALGAIASLRLSYTESGSQTMHAITHTEREKLWCLELDGCRVDARAAVEMAQATLPALRRLSLASAAIDGADLMLSSPWVNHLERLDVSGTRIGALGWHHLIDSDNAMLESLFLATTSPGNDAAARLQEAPWRTSIKTLSLARNGLEDHGILPMFQESWPSLRHLDLSGKILSFDLLHAMMEGDFPSLEVLDITDMMLPPGLERELLESKNLPKLRDVRSFGIAIG